MRFRRWLVGRQSFIAMLLLVFFLALAPFLYFYGWRTLFIRIYRYDAEMILSLQPDYRGLFRYDSCCMPRNDLVDDRRLCTVRIDAERRREVGGNQPGVPEVVFLGDSNLFGQSLSQGETIADFLVREALHAGTALRVSNYAVPGNNSRIALHQARRILTGDIVALVVGVGANDCKPVSPAVSRAVDELIAGFASGDGRLQVLGRYAWEIVKDRLRGILAPDSSMPLVAVEEYYNNLESIAELARQRGVAMIVMPTNGCWEVGEGRVLNERYFQAVARLVERRPYLKVIDRCGLLWDAIPSARMHPYFAAERVWIENTYRRELLGPESLYWVTTDFGHPNPIGAEVLADAIYRAFHECTPAVFKEPGDPPWHPTP